MRHHPSCPEHSAHVHPSSSMFVSAGHIVWVEGWPLAATGDLATAERVAELINTHGLADVPNHLPDDLVWGPPASEPIIDWRLPTNPNHPQNQENLP